LLRKLATLIVGGKIRAIKLNNFNLKNNSKEIPKISKHGKEWHQEVISIINKSLSSKNYKTSIEPILAQGRADLVAKPQKSNSKTIYVEVGSVSFYKLWYNLSTLQGINLLIITNENKVIILKN